jgi:hypothetical protein
VKLLEGGTQAGGISAFLGKAVEPPAAAVVQHAVSSLQLIGALTCVVDSTAAAMVLHLKPAQSCTPGHENGVVHSTRCNHHSISCHILEAACGVSNPTQPYKHILMLTHSL